MINKFEADGRVWFRGLLSQQDITALEDVCENDDQAGSRLGVTGPVGEALKGFYTLDQAMGRILAGACPVRIVAFNKTAEGNWGVPWHQDRVIAVRQRHDIASCKNWSKKAGVWHCEPPVSILSEMLFVRIHLDDQGEENGAMEIALGSHKAGVQSAEEIARSISGYKTEICEASRGDVLVLKMLLLHRSRPSSLRTSRRALRVDYGAGDLPLPLVWG